MRRIGYLWKPFIYTKSINVYSHRIMLYRWVTVSAKHPGKSSILIKSPFHIFSRKHLAFKHHHDRNFILKVTHSLPLSFKAVFSDFLENRNMTHITHFYALLFLINLCILSNCAYCFVIKTLVSPFSSVSRHWLDI